MLLEMDICECDKNHGINFILDPVLIKTSYGPLKIFPRGQRKENDGPNFGFCKCCKKPFISREVAKKLVRQALEEKQKDLGFLIGSEIRALREKTGLKGKEFAELVKIDNTTISGLENGYLLQTKMADQIIRMKSQEYIKQNDPSRKKLKAVFAYLMRHAETSKLFLNKMMFYVDFWNYKNWGKSITGADYIPLQYGPCPNDYQEILQEMINDHEITPIYGHCFTVNNPPDMSEFSAEELKTIDRVVALASTDKGKKLFDLSHEEKGFIETPLYETISYEYAKDLKIEELLNEIAETG